MIRKCIEYSVASWLAPLVVTLALAAQDPIQKYSVFLAPYQFGLLYPSDTFCDVMLSQRKIAAWDWCNATGTDPAPFCGVEFLDMYLRSSDRSVFMISSHGNEDMITAEAYIYEADRDSAWNRLNDAGFLGALDKTSSQYGFGIAMFPQSMASRWTGGGNDLVILSACKSIEWAPTAFPGARCIVGCKSGVDCTQQQGDILLRCLDGQYGADKRTVANSISGTMDDTLEIRGDGDTNLAPMVLGVSPEAQSEVSESREASIYFDSEMYEGFGEWRNPVTLRGPAVLRDPHWDSAENRLDFTIDPFGPGEIEVTVTHDCMSASLTWIDGNQQPVASNGRGPAGDEYVYVLESTVPEDRNTVTRFDGAWAFQSGDSAHVLWVSDPEIGSEEFRVWGGPSRQQLLLSVPAAGGDLPHYYEVVMPGGWTEFEIVEQDSSASTEDETSGQVALSTYPPANLAELRNLNDVVSGWTPTELTAYREYPDTTRDDTVADFVFYTSRADFLPGIYAIMGRLSEDGWTSRWARGSSDPNEARSTFRDAYEDAVAQHYWHVPLCVIVGEANEGAQPERNIVGTYYVPDDGGECFFGTCASDLEMTNFYGNGPECPVTRVVAATESELTNCVNTTLEYYNRVNVDSARVEMLVGDRDLFCEVVDPPGDLMDQVQQWYSGRGIPVQRRNESDYDCYAWAAGHDVFCADMNAGVTELIGAGRQTDRSRLPGIFCRKNGNPVFSISELTHKQRIVVELPGCDMGDVDRNNATYYPTLAKEFLTNPPDSGTSAVAWVGYSRAGLEMLHSELSREFFSERINGKFHWAIQEVYWTAIRKLWAAQPAMRPFLREAMALGFPVQLRGFLTPAGVGSEFPKEFKVSLATAPNPGRTPEILYEVPGLAKVSVAVYGVDGRVVRQLVAEGGPIGPGRYRVRWDGKNEDGRRVPGGVYFARMAVDGKVAAVRKVVIMK